MDLLNLLSRKLRIARELSLPDWFSLVRDWWLLLFFYLTLRWVSFARLNQWLPRSSKKDSAPNEQLLFAERARRLVDLAARLHALPMTCLVKSLTLRWLLVRRGLPAALKIGVLKVPGGIQAHAWIEVHDTPVGEAEDVSQRFKILGSVEQFKSADVKLV